MDGWINPHRDFVPVLGCDLVVHIEQVSVLGGDAFLAVALDGVLEIEVDSVPGCTDSQALIAHLLRPPGCDVAGDKIAEGRIEPLKVVVALRFRDVARVARIARLLGNPDPAVVPEALAHERELRLMLARDRNAGRMDLREAGVAEERAPLVRAPDRRRVRLFCVGREIEDVAVSARREDHGNVFYLSTNAK